MDYLDCPVQTLSKRNESVAVVCEKQCAIMLVVYGELLLEVLFEMEFQQHLPTSPPAHLGVTV